MLIRSILTIAVLGTFVFGAAANAGQVHTENTRLDGGMTAPVEQGTIFASAGGLGTTR